MSNSNFTPGPTANTVRAADGKLLTAPDDWSLLPPGDAGLTRRVPAGIRGSQLVGASYADDNSPIQVQLDELANPVAGYQPQAKIQISFGPHLPSVQRMENKYERIR